MKMGFVKVLRVGVFLLYSACFIYYSFKNIQDFYNSELGVKLKIADHDQLELPSVTICHSKSFLFKGKENRYFLNPEDFLADTSHLQDSWTLAPILSPNLGKCYTFKPISLAKYTDEVYIKLNPDQKLKVFIHDQGSEFWLQLGIITPFAPVEKFEIDTSLDNGYTATLIELSKKTFKAITECDDLATLTNYTQCIFDEKASKNEDWMNFVNTPKVEADLSVDNFNRFNIDDLKESYDKLVDLMTDSSDCLQHCLRIKYEAQASTFHFAATKDGLFNANISIPDFYSLAFTYRAMQVQEEENYLIHDLEGLVASLGGNLGLFLGFSALSLSYDVIDYLHVN